MENEQLVEALNEFETEKGISKEVIIDILKDALEKGYQKEYSGAVCRVEIDPETGQIEMFEVKTVVEEVEDDAYEIELEDAHEIDKNKKVGDVVEFPIDIDAFQIIMTKLIKQVFTQKIREHEKQTIYDEFIDKKDDLIVGIVEKVEPERNNILINLGKASAILKRNHTLPNDDFKEGTVIKVYVVDIDKNAYGAPIIVSRTVPGFLKRVFESEIHEVYDGTVEIKRIARQAGIRSKVAVFSRNKNVDPAGACIGQRGSRIQNISAQLQGEKIDVIEYFEDKILFIAEALKPAEVVGVQLGDDENQAIAVVKDDDLSLAIGKGGINSRLASRLTGMQIEILPQEEAYENNIEFKLVSDARHEYETAKFIEETTKIEPEVIEQPVVSTQVTTPEVEVPVVEPSVTVAPTPTKPKKEKVVKPAPRPKPLPDIKIPGVPASQPSFKKPVRKRDDERVDTKRTIISSKEVEDLKKKLDEARAFMPVYTDEELEEIESTQEESYTEDFYDDIDFEDYDDYYDED